MLVVEPVEELLYKCGYNGDGAPAISFKLDNPRGLTGDNNGNLYIANYGGNFICYTKL